MFSAPWPVRAAFRGLELVAPTLGGRWAAHIWFTLPRPRPSGVAGGSRAGQEPSTVDGTPFVSSVDGHEVAGMIWGEGPAVYLVHGWAGHSGQFAGFVDPLVRKGFRVVTFDMPSHGRSGPGGYGRRSTTLVEFTRALEQVIARYGRPHAIVAHSAGAIAAAAYLCDASPLSAAGRTADTPASARSADRVVLLAPMASAISGARHLQSVLGFGERTLIGMVAIAERRVRAPMRYFDVPDLGRAASMPPTLVVHDRADTMTPVADGAAIAAAWTGARLRVTEGLSHTRVLRSPAVIGEVVDFIAR
jgi:pimeloyl-ACP methyl ester carboxylesterase